MNTLIPILLMGILQASPLSMKNAYVSMQVENESLENIIWDLKEQSGLTFVYSTEDVSNVDGITLNLQDASIETVLNECLENSELDYSMSESTVVIMKADKAEESSNDVAAETTTVEEKNIEIKGKVTDEDGITLPGATIMEKGTLNGTTTDIDGNFSLAVKDANSILKISFIGFETQEITVGTQTTINIVLEPSVNSLEEVVITGIFTRKAESFAGSAVTFKADDLKRVGNSNVLQSLKNLDPSLSLMTNFLSGSDPNKLPSLQMRGTSSLPGAISNSDLRGNYASDPNQPLFILDGFEASATRVFDLDDDRVESITFLKDAAAKAIYGSKASNGVIVIELKRPTMGEFRLSYRAALDIQAPDLSSYNLTNALEKLEVEQIAGEYITNGVTNQLRLQDLYNYRYKKSVEGDDTYWLSKPLRTGIGSKQTISAEMGTQKAQYRADFSYNDVKGVMKGSGRTNISGSVSIQYRMKNFLFRNIMSVISNNSSDSPYGSFYDYTRMNPYWNAYNEDGSVATGVGTIDEYVNPLLNATLSTNFTSSYFDFVDNFYTEWKPTEGLTATVRIGINTRSSKADRFYPYNHTNFMNYSDDDLYRKGSYTINQGNGSGLSGDFAVRYNKNIDKHFIMSTFRFNMAENSNYEVVNYAEGFPGERMNDIAFALQYAANKTPFTNENTTREIGFTGQFGYTYDNRILSDVTIRRSASSQFGANKRWGTFWSFSLGWNIHKEKFMDSFYWLKKLKLRSSIGTTGNQNFSSYQAIPTYDYYLNQVYKNQFGVYLPSLANENLQWQQKMDYNIGFDFAAKKVKLTFDYYTSYTENLIANLSIAPSYGYSIMKSNIGKVKNSGFDVNLTYTVLQSKDGFLNITASVLTNTNKIVNLSDAMKKFNADQDKRSESTVDGGLGIPLPKYVDGGSLNSIWAVPSLGIDPATGLEIFVKRDGTTTNVWKTEDQVIVGNSQPKYRGNIGFNAEYKGFGFSVVANYLAGGDYYNSTLVNKVENVYLTNNVDRRILTGRWREPGQDADYIRLSKIQGSDGQWNVVPKTKPTTRFVQKRSELHLSSISAYYNFKKAWIEKIGLEKLKIRANLNDIYTFSTIQIERGTSYPFARNISISLNATF